MIININGLQLGGNSDLHIESPVEGLETPPIRTSSQDYSGADGGRVNGQYYSKRLITLTGFMKFNDCNSHESARKNLQSHLPIRENITIEITTFAGHSYYTEARVLDIKMPYVNSVFSKFKIDLVCPDSYLYTGLELNTNLPLTMGGGVIIPAIFPIILSASTTPAIVTNNGSIKAYPKIEIIGSATNPVFTKYSTGESVSFNLNMSSADVLTIDMQKKTAILNGGSVISLINNKNWFYLDVGDNQILYSTSDTSNTGQATIYWKNGVVSI